MSLTAAVQYVAIRDNILRELAAETARRASIVEAGNPAVVSYTVAGKQASWTEYMTAMQALADKYNLMALQAGGDGGLVEVVQRGWS